ncbi:MAG: hypothetical protein SVR81_05670 [Chloroflexota bacterium]|nr:hypothetical protein [Chloroflexota bacterium]
MYCKKISKKLIWGGMLIMLILAAGFPCQTVMSEELRPDTQNKFDCTTYSIQTDKNRVRISEELSEKEFNNEMDKLDKLSEGHIVLYNLEDPEGIDPNLLPAGIAGLVDDDTNVVAYKETNRPKPTQPIKDSETFESSINCFTNGIPCASPDGSRDVTTSTNFGAVTQYNRVYALRYDNAPWNRARPLTGWQFEKMWSKWTRTNTEWSVAEAGMTLVAGQTQDFCTGEILGEFKYSSISFDPEWISDTSTNWFSISGFTSSAYVPSPYHMIAFTQADIYQDFGLAYNDAKTRHYFSSHPK